MSILIIFALSVGYAFAQWLSFNDSLIIGNVVRLSWNLSNDEDWLGPWDIFLGTVDEPIKVIYWVSPGEETRFCLRTVVNLYTQLKTNKVLRIGRFGVFNWIVPNFPSTKDRVLCFYTWDHDYEEYFYLFSPISIKTSDSGSTSDRSSSTIFGTPVTVEGTPVVIEAAEATSTTAQSDEEPKETDDCEKAELIDSGDSDSPTSTSPTNCKATSSETNTDPSPDAAAPVTDATDTTDAADVRRAAESAPSPSNMSAAALAGIVVASFLLFVSLLTLTLTYIHRRGRRSRLLQQAQNSAEAADDDSDLPPAPTASELESPSTSPPAWNRTVARSSAATLGPAMAISPLSSSATGEMRPWERHGREVHELSTDGAVMRQSGGQVARAGLTSDQRIYDVRAREAPLAERREMGVGMGEVGVARMVWVGSPRGR